MEFETQILDGEQVEIAWRAIPGSQELAVTCPCNEILYDGSRGPGKTDAQVMRFRSLVGLGYGRFLRGIIFDRQYKNLDDLIAKSEKHFYKFADGARFLRSKSDYCWIWPTGEVLYFRQIKRESDYLNFHGQEFPWIGFNELTKYPNRKIYDLIKSCNRSSFIPELHTPKNPETGEYLTPDGKPLPPIPLQIFSTTNPWGPGHSWVKEYFVDAAEPGEVVETVTNVYNPRSKQRENIVRTKVRLFGTYKENVYLDPVYIANLESETDPERRKAWLLGDWNIRSGGMFSDLFNESVHVLDNFTIPANWALDRSFDWGSSKPFSVGWWAVSNGESVKLPNGKSLVIPKNSLVRVFEWYGTSGAPNDGLRLSAPEIAGGIMEREVVAIREKWITKIPQAGVADPSIFSVRERDVASIGSKMEAEGVPWKHCPELHSAGSRVNGWQLIRDRLKNALDGEGEGLYFLRRCKHAIKFFQDTPRDEENPDDVDTECEDHLQDETRYRVLDASGNVPGSLNLKYPT